MVSKRARVSRNLGTVINDISTKAEDSAIRSRVPVENTDVEARLTELEDTVGDLASPNFRLEQEYDTLDDRYAAAGTGSTAMPALPDPFNYGMNGNQSIDGAAATWTDIDANFSVTYTLTRPLWVMVEGTGNMRGDTSTYGMIGVQATGALALEPEVGLDGSTGKFGFTAYTETTSNGTKTLAFHKPLLLPIGTTTLKMRKRRNVTTGTPLLAYPTMMVTPVAWDDAPIVISPSKAALTKRTLVSVQNYTSSPTVILWDSSMSDSGHFSYNGATGEFTCLTPGQYRLTLSLGTGAVGTTAWFKGEISVNGSLVGEFIGDRATVAGRAGNTSTTVTLVAGDKVTAQQATQTAGGAITASGSRTYLELVPVVVTTDDNVIEDTGWVTLSSYLNSGFTGTVEGRRIGKDVEIRGTATTTAGWAAGSNVQEFLDAIPVEWRPTGRNAIGSGYMSGYSVIALVRPAGTGAFSNRTAASASTSVQFTIRYLID